MTPTPARMNICLVTSAYPPTADGFATYARDLAVSLVNLGHGVTVLCSDHRDTLLQEPLEYEDAGVQVVRLSPRLTLTGRMLSAASGLTQLGHSYDIYAALRRYHKRAPFDVIEFSNWHAPALIHSLCKLAPQVVRASTTVRQASKDLAAKGGTRRQRRERSGVRKLVWLEALTLRRSDLIIVPNRSHWREVAADYRVDSRRNDAVAIIPLGIDVVSQALTLPTRDRASICRLLYVGRLSYRKGFDVFMRALPEIIGKAQYDISVTIIGEDVAGEDGASTWERLSKELDERTQQRITYLGLATDSERDENYRKADIFIGPSRYESFGLMYVEAMAYGVPVIGSRVGGIPEVIEDGVTGLLAEPDSTEALAGAVLRLVNDEDLRRKMGVAARASVTHRFTRERMAEAALDAYRSLYVRRTVGFSAEGRFRRI